jgi:hypothetical protein
MLVLLFSTLVSCQYEWIEFEQVDPGKQMSLANDVEPIFAARNCTNCHDGANKFSLKQGESFNELTGRGLINLGAPADSKILTTPHAASGYAGTDTQIIKVWIEQGAKNN